jgi:hypothetical protein
MTLAAQRDLLQSTGTPQMGGSRQPIGPRPDLARAIAKMSANQTGNPRVDLPVERLARDERRSQYYFIESS